VVAHGGPREGDTKGIGESVVAIYMGTLKMVDRPTSPRDSLIDMDTLKLDDYKSTKVATLMGMVTGFTAKGVMMGGEAMSRT